MKNRKGKSLRSVLSIMLVLVMLFGVMMPVSYADEIAASETNGQEQTESLEPAEGDDETATDSAIEDETSGTEGEEQTKPTDETADDNKAATDSAIEDETSGTEGEEQTKPTDETGDGNEAATDSAIEDEAAETNEQEEAQLLEIEALELSADAVYWTDNLITTPGGFTVDETDPDKITINSAEGLAWLAVRTSGLNGQEIDDFDGKTVTLTDNIDLSKKQWTSIGRYQKKTSFASFQGTFDGGDYTISGLKIYTLPDDIENKYSGLFGYVEEGNIKNVHLADVNISIDFDDSNKPKIGSVAGRLGDNVTVENCTVTGTLKGISVYGITYNCGESDSILKCAFSGTMSAKASAYGITNSCHGTIDQCCANASISSDSSASGICGNVYGTVSNCYTRGTINATNTNIGGICGVIKYTSKTDAGGNIENCYSTMTVKGESKIGGIVGNSDTGKNQFIKGCVALNDTVTSEDGDNAGRILGDFWSKGYANYVEVKKNFAYTGMKVYAKDEDGEDKLYLMGLPDTERMASDKQGEDITAEDLAEGWAVNGWDEDVWSLETGKLPTLKKLSGEITQSGTMPDYISADSEKDWNITAFDELDITTPEMALGDSAEDAAALLPAKLFGTKDGDTAVSIPEVTWASDDYNGNEVGEYTFTAVLPEVGYEASADLPAVKVNVLLKYKVSFDTNGAPEIATLSIEYENLVTKPEDPARDGFKFEGWYKDEGYNETWIFETDKVTAPVTLYAKWSIDGDPDYTASEYGERTLDVSEMGFINASVVSISNTDGYTTYAVVVNQTIGFCVPAGSYVVADSGETAASLLQAFLDNGNEIKQLDGYTPQELSYKGSGLGTAEEPLSIIANFFTEDASQLTEKADFVSLTFRVLSLIAGYDTEGMTDYGTPYCITVEDRDTSTGRLEASFAIDGSKLEPCYCAGWFRSPREYGIMLNPSDALINGHLDTPSDILNKTYHTFYISEDYPERYNAALETLKAVREDGKKVLMMHTQTRDFPGPVTFKIDVSGYFNDGDTVNINYLLGAANLSLYHASDMKALYSKKGKNLQEYMLALEPTYIKNNTSAVVEDGYLTFDLSNGGYFELVKSEDDTPRTEYAVEFVTNTDADGEIYPSTICPQIVESGNKAAKPDDPAEDDYTFEGWYTNEERTEPFDFDTVITEDLMLYAKWSSNGGPGGPGGPGTPVGKTYTVEFITGKTSSGEPSATIASQVVEEGKKAEDPGADCPFGFYDRGDGYLVLDWYTDEKLKNKFRFSTAIKENIKLYPEYQRYILKDDGKADSGKGSKNNPYKVKLGDTKQSKIAWKFFNKLAKGTFKGYYKVYVEEDNDGDELFSWTFNGDDFNTCDTAQPYYIYITPEKVGDTLELEMVNRTAIEGAVTISVDISKYIKEGEVEIEYKSGSCDGMVVHSNVEWGDWVQSHHKPKSYFTDTTATVKKGYITFDITHGGTYIIKSDQLIDDGSSGSTTGSNKAIEKETIKAGEKIDAAKLKSILDEGKHLLIKSDNGTALFDTKAIKALQEKNKGNIEISIDAVENEKLSEKQKKLAGDKVSERPIYSLTAKSGSQKITTFGKGKVTVTLPYTLKGTEQSLGVVIWYLNDKGELADIPCDYDAEKKEVTFTTNHFSYYVVGYDKNLEWENPFSDVKETDWFFKAVANINKSGFMSGVTKTEFKPNANTTRAMLVTILYRMEGSPEADNPVIFKDVAKTSWYTEAVCWAVKNEIVSGYDKFAFGPNDAITREQLVSILYRYKKMKKADLTAAGTVEEFEDADQISSWAADSVKWAIGANILTGKGNGSLDPKGNATRAEVAAVIERIKGSK